ncbi:protein indeterminate-domain 5, chloroplastic-like [Vigna umbellata]|uniref:protein indeterminate-domain 5, chloroplastic-like n=1 Tax=Vigna umbellata TaxID=87088 RepID=UPI001F5EA21A|nr:protein indeterminate-domain 5, chloroplastic-like [Vigna umbellata]
MASGSSSTPFLGIRQENQTQVSQQHQSSTAASSSTTTTTTSTTTTPTTMPQKKRRNQPGTPCKFSFSLLTNNHVKETLNPAITYRTRSFFNSVKADYNDPDAEVIALSPKTLMATNRFICEVCNKGFQREQNLQLHRRGHNLPWKLKQKSNKEPKRKVYLCPEPTCVHHDPSRALGDLTGIKKHYSRKHGEKKWKCDKCSKKYAVQSDWKAHSKTCGTREYRCDCGTLFSSSSQALHCIIACNPRQLNTAKVGSETFYALSMSMSLNGNDTVHSAPTEFQTTVPSPITPQWGLVISESLSGSESEYAK